MEKKQINQYSIEYNKTNYDRMALYLPKGTREKLKEKASARGLSVNALLNQIILDFIAENETNETDAQKTATADASEPEEKQ